jgi:hypothetical protein
MKKVFGYVGVIILVVGMIAPVGANIICLAQPNILEVRTDRDAYSPGDIIGLTIKNVGDEELRSRPLYVNLLDRGTEDETVWSLSVHRWGDDEELEPEKEYTFKCFAPEETSKYLFEVKLPDENVEDTSNLFEVT